MKQPTILVVDDKENMLGLMSKVLGDDGRVLTADGGGAALSVLSKEKVDVILCDLKMPDMDGLEVLQATRRLSPQTEFILMTAFASVGTAVEALKLGAYDYLTKPFEPDEARAVVLRAASRGARAEPGGEDDMPLPGVFARSQPMKQVASLVEKVARGDATALIVGETGTGKERIARAVHELGPRAKGRFVAVNCAAIPPELLESELFGHKKGAFTGATSDKKGLFEEAQGGSLFLDEIGDMLPSLQAKLTRVLEERAVRRVGETNEHPVDVRMIAATHRDLEKMVRAETFREDLWYRLNVALIQLPALRDRPGDVELLADRFLAEQSERLGGETPSAFQQTALEALLSYEWPGNVRQLRSAIERACLVAEGDLVRIGDLPPEVIKSEFGADEDPALASRTWAKAVEYGREQTARRYLTAVLRRFAGNVTEAARHADVERESFYRLLRKHGIDPIEFRTKDRVTGARR